MSVICPVNLLGKGLPLLFVERANDSKHCQLGHSLSVGTRGNENTLWYSVALNLLELLLLQQLCLLGRNDKGKM